MRIHFIVNPVAGRRRALSTLEVVARALEVRGLGVSRYVTQGPGDAARHVAGLGDGDFDRLVVVGGDGTLREVINARTLPLPWPVGIVPMGTANLAGRELRMPRTQDGLRIAACLASAQPWPVDLLRVARDAGPEELAVSTVGVGLDAEMVRAVAALRAGAQGAGGYARWIGPMWNALRAFRFPHLRVTVDGRRTYAASACVVQNARSFGGLFVLSPDAALDSGHAEVFLIRARTHRDLFRIVAGSFLRRVHRQHDVKLLRASHVSVRATGPVPVQADGDPAGTTDLTVGVLPAAVTLLRA